MVSEETLRFRKAVISLKKQVVSSTKTVKRLAKQGDYLEAWRLHESTSGLKWAIDHIKTFTG